MKFNKNFKNTNKVILLIIFMVLFSDLYSAYKLPDYSLHKAQEDRRLNRHKKEIIDYISINYKISNYTDYKFIFEVSDYNKLSIYNVKHHEFEKAEFEIDNPRRITTGTYYIGISKQNLKDLYDLKITILPFIKNLELEDNKSLENFSGEYIYKKLPTILIKKGKDFSLNRDFHFFNKLIHFHVTFKSNDNTLHIVIFEKFKKFNM
jgi:hypothetical protein